MANSVQLHPIISHLMITGDDPLQQLKNQVIVDLLQVHQSQGPDGLLAVVCHGQASIGG